MKELWKQSPGRARWVRQWELDSGLDRTRPKVWLALLWEPRDLWVGVYWDRPDVAWEYALDVYVTVVPCLPLKVMLRWAGWHITPRKVVSALRGLRGPSPA